MKLIKNKVISHIIALLLFFPVVIFSQKKQYEYVPFPTSNAIWSEIYHFKDDLNWQPPVYERFAINGEDTIINEIVYKKIYLFSDAAFDKNTASYVGALREDEQKKIWLKMDNPLHPYKPAIQFDNTKEILLYDFSVNEGDVINSEYLNIRGGYAMVEKVDIIEVGNSYRKKIKIKTDEYTNLEWIEGIGSLQGLFFTPTLYTPICSCETNDLIGFKYQDEILYFNNAYPSFYPTNIQAINSDKIQLIPLSGTSFMFDSSNKDISVIQIFNIEGILQTTLQKEFILNTNNYNSGIYIYKIMNNSGNSYVGKFIVQ